MLTTREVIKTFYNALVHKLKKYRGNWDQNDPSATDYIKNKPFYTDESKKENVVKFMTFTTNSDFEWCAPFVFEIAEGNTYEVKWDGKTYICDALNDRGALVIGNINLDLGVFDGKEPFLYYYYNDSEYGLCVYSRGKHSISISTSPIKKIDKKYIPSLNLAQVATSGSYWDLLDTPTVYEDTVRYSVNQQLTDWQKQQARKNIDAMADIELAKVATNGNYDYLSNKPVGDIFYEDVKFGPFRTSINTDSTRYWEVDKSIFFEKKDYEGQYYIRNNNNGTIREYTGTAKLYFIENESNETEYYYSLQFPSYLFLTVKFQVVLNDIYTSQNFIWLNTFTTSIEQVDITFKDLAIKKLKQLDPKFLPDGVPVVPVETEDEGKVLGVVGGSYDLVSTIKTVNSISPDTNGNVSITPDSLGLSSAMKFQGVVTTLPTSSTAGSVVLMGNKEYVYDSNGNWVELGDEGSHALKTITITAGSGLTGGGTLEANRTIAHSNVITAGTAKGGSGTLTSGGTFTVPSISYDANGHITSATTTTYTLPVGVNAGNIIQTTGDTLILDCN